MAELLGVTERHYQKIEYGHINVSATTLILLADYFHVTTDYLLGREDTDEWHTFRGWYVCPLNKNGQN